MNIQPFVLRQIWALIQHIILGESHQNLSRSKSEEKNSKLYFA